MTWRTGDKVRAGYGAVLMLAPAAVVWVMRDRRKTTALTVTIRILGSRDVAQAAFVAWAPRWRSLGFWVDVLHASSMVGAALLSRRHRVLAGTSAAVAAMFAAREWSHEAIRLRERAATRVSSRAQAGAATLRQRTDA